MDELGESPLEQADQHEAEAITPVEHEGEEHTHTHEEGGPTGSG